MTTAPPHTPRVVVVTDGTIAAAAGRSVLAAVAAAVDGGADTVLLREKDLPAGERRRLADELRALTAAHQAELWMASDVVLARDVGADGVHLAAADSWPATDGSWDRRGRWATGSVPGSDHSGRIGGTDRQLRVGRSCHDIAELRAARAAGADWATYSPVFATPSKPGYGPPLGRDGLAAGCAAVPGLPVVALGGITAGVARGCVDAGAAGVALMGAVMGAADPAAVVRAVVAELARVDA